MSQLSTARSSVSSDCERHSLALFQRTCSASAYTRSACGRGSRNNHTQIEIRCSDRNRWLHLFIFVHLKKNCCRHQHSRPSILKLTSATRSDFPRNTMRADLTLMALAHESNRYLLTRLIAKATRKLHRPKTRLQDTMNDALKRFGCSKPRAAHRTAEASSSSVGRAA